MKLLNEKGSSNDQVYNGPELFPGKKINNICYADDLMTMILTKDYINVAVPYYQRNLDSIQKIMGEIFLSFNISKTGRT